MIPVILASASPRRRELLSQLVANYTVLALPVDETLPDSVPPVDAVCRLAVRKGEAVLPRGGDATMILSSDTLVELDGHRLGKPQDPEDAVRMLRTMSGRVHRVHTGVAVHYRGVVRYGVATTAVSFRELSERQIRDYVQTGEPMDKAGAYGIQGLGGALVAGYDGDFDTVVGLSLRLTHRLMCQTAALFDERLSFLPPWQ